MGQELGAGLSFWFYPFAMSLTNPFPLRALVLYSTEEREVGMDVV